MKEKVKVPTLVYSRVVGYYSSTNLWNIGKQQEFKDRKVYKVDKAIERMDNEVAQAGGE